MNPVRPPAEHPIAVSGPTSAGTTAWSFRPDIEGLRAVAIVAVVLYHVGWSGMSAGYLGVDVFFVLSGYLITGILADEVERTGRISLVRFWARRARRLLPAGTVLIVAVLVADLWVQSPYGQSTTAKAARAFALYASNLFFAWRGTNYFAADLARNPLLHTWSLSVEEQFYLLYAPLFWLAARSRIGRDRSAFRRRFALLTAALTALSFAGCLFLLRQNAVYAFYLLPPRAWEFGFGALTALLTAQATTRIRLWPVVAPIAFLLLIATFVRFNTTQHPGWVTLVPVLCTVALIVSGPKSSLLVRILSWPVVRAVGRLSYSWYLWHWPVLVWTRAKVPNASPLLLSAMAIVSLLPAAATYALVESPIRFSRRLQRYPKQVVSGAITVAGLTFLAAFVALRHSDAILRRPEMSHLGELRSTPLFSNGCMIGTGETVPLPCVFGPSRNDTTVVLFGDSHAAQWFPALLRISSERGWRLIAWTKSGCPAVDVTVISRERGRPYGECDIWRDTVFDRIGALRPTMVVIGSYSGKYALTRGDTTFEMDSPSPRYSVWTDGLATTLERLTRSAGRVIVLQDTPHPKFEIPDCLALHLRDPTQCDFSRSSAVDTVLTTREADAVRKTQSASYVAVADLICHGDRCGAERDGIVRYFDDHHISANFAESVAPVLSQRLDSAIRRPDAHDTESSARVVP